MSGRFLFLLFTISLALIIVFFGCRSKTTNPDIVVDGADTTSLTMIDVAEIIRSVTPPVYSAPVGMPANDSFGVWTQGDYPLLEKVFGDEEPQTLERNLYEFEFFMDMFDDILLVDENGDIVTGTYIDSVTREEQGEQNVYHGTFEVSALSALTTIPTIVQGIIGTSYDLDYLIEITIDEIPGGQVKVGFSIDSTEQAMIVWISDMSDEPGTTESSIVYSTLDPRDSTFIFKGAMFYIWEAGTYSVAYVISSESSGEFGYRASWIYDQVGYDDYTTLGSIIGGGNKDDEFALKYRQFYPVDAQNADSTWNFDEVFGPNYTNGNGLITSFSSYVNEELIIGYELMPLAVIANPWAQ